MKTIVFAAVIGCLLSGCSNTDPQEAKPNVVVVLVDDLGWADLGVYGSSLYQTPAIDRLASEGVRFAQFYSASPVCSPTRASLMTGRHPARLQITNWIGGEQNGLLNQAHYERQLPLSEYTLGEAFSDAGYATGYIGKWHLGKQGFMPEDQGFDYTFAVNYAGQPGSYFAPYKNENWPITNVPDLGQDGPEDYLTDRLTDEAVRFIEAHKDSSFLLVLSHYAVHTPIQGKEELVQKYEEIVGSGPRETDTTLISESGRAFSKSLQDNPAYAAMVQSTDESVAHILESLERVDLDERTIVVLISDNGGLSTLARKAPRTATSNLPLRAGKGWLYEGGIRIPLIIRIPDQTSPGRVVDEYGATSDLMPTLASLAGVDLPTEVALDGEDLSPMVIEGKPTREAGELYWHFPHYHGSGNRPSVAIRSGDLKLIEWLEDGDRELYNLKSDPYEQTNLANRELATAAELSDKLHSWLTAVGAQMPTPAASVE